MLKLLTEIMILLFVYWYAVKQKYDAVNSIIWPTIRWKCCTVGQGSFSLKWYWGLQGRFFTKNGTQYDKLPFHLNDIQCDKLTLSLKMAYRVTS